MKLQKVLSVVPKTQDTGYVKYTFSILDQFELDNYECYCLFADPHNDYGTNLHELETIDYQEDLIIWSITDSLIGQQEYNWYSDKLPYGLNILLNICKKFPNKKFIITTEQYGLQKYIDVENLFIVDYRSVNHHFDRKKYFYKPCFDKIKTKKQILFLNNSETFHRVASVCYFVAQGYDKNSYLTVSDHIFQRIKNSNVIDLTSIMRFSPNQLECIKQGANKISNNNFSKAIIKPYWENDFWNQNITNYNKNLYRLYQRSYLEIISGSLFQEETPFLSEKELQAWYGCTMPIFLGPANTVDYIRKILGLDVLDDLINHDYDKIKDPALRLFAVFDYNKHLLDGSVDLAKEWSARKKRIFDNCNKFVDDSIDAEQKAFAIKNWQKAFDYFNITHKKILD